MNSKLHTIPPLTTAELEALQSAILDGSLGVKTGLITARLANTKDPHERTLLEKELADLRSAARKVMDAGQT